MYAGKKFWKFWEMLDKIKINEPKFRVHSNIDGKPYE